MEIKITNINKTFNKIPLFKDYNYSIKDNSFTIITGTSGCGKTTLLNIIAGLEGIESGFVQYYLQDIEIKKAKLKLRRDHISIIFQNYALLNDESVFDNLMFALKISKLSSDIKYKKINEVLTKVDLLEKIDCKIYELSGGQQQRIALARAMLKDYDLILADEPTGNLDEDNANKVISILKKLHTEGKTIILVTHDKSLLAYATDIIHL